jgi:hypothetical protein
MGSRIGLDNVEMRKTCFYGDSNSDPSANNDHNVLRKSAQKHLFPLQHVPTIIPFAFEAQFTLVAHVTGLRDNMYNSLEVSYCVTRN